jgi:hypothetical protein
MFHKATLYGNMNILKNIDKDIVDNLLNRLVRRDILEKGFFITSEERSKQ